MSNSSSRKAVTIDGVEYNSRSNAAKALIANGKTISEAAELSGMTYQTVYAVTKGAEKVAVRRSKYRVLNMGKGCKHSLKDIATKTEIHINTVRKMLEKAGLYEAMKKAIEEKSAKEKVVSTETKAKDKTTTKPEKVDTVKKKTSTPKKKSTKKIATVEEIAMADMKEELETVVA